MRSQNHAHMSAQISRVVLSAILVFSLMGASFTTAFADDETSGGAAEATPTATTTPDTGEAVTADPDEAIDEDAAADDPIVTEPEVTQPDVEAPAAQDVPATAEAPAAPKSAIDPQSEVEPQADNGLAVTWILNDKWIGTGTNTDYTMTPVGGLLGIQALVGINSSTVYPRGTAHFTLPKTLLTYRDGTTCDIVSMGAQKKVDNDPDDTHDYGAASYWYYEDDGNGNYVFTNCQEIPSNDTKVFSITYQINTDKVPANTVATLTPADVTSGLTSSGAKITFQNNVEIDQFTKTVLNNGTGVRTLPASSMPNPTPGAPYPNGYWFGRTAAQFNFKDNMYMVYRLDTHSTGNEPHTISWNDTLSANDAAKGAKIIGMSIDSNGLHYVKPIEGVSGTYFYGEYDTNNVVTTGPDNHIQSASGWQYCYVLVEYPKASYGVISPGDTARFNNTATATVQGIDDPTPKSENDDAEGSWTKSQPGDSGGDGSRKYTGTHDLSSAAAMLFNNKNVDLPTYTLQSMTWEADKTTTPATQPVRDIYLIDDTLTAQNPAGGYRVLGDGDYYLKTLSFAKGVTEAYWSDDADAYVGKPDHHGSFEIWASSSKTGAYTKIADRTFDEINGGTNLTVTVPANTVKWYVVYKGDKTSPADQPDAYVIFNVYATYTLVGSAPVWDTLLPTDTTSTVVSNSVAIPTVDASTGKLTDYTAGKDYTTTYQGNWSPDFDPANPNAAPNNERDTLIAADLANWGSMIPAGRTEVGLPRLWGETVVTLSPVEGLNSTGKQTVGAVTPDPQNGRAIVNFNQWGYEYYTISGESLDINIDDLNLTIERDSAVFYDLLPAGMKLLDDDAVNHPITARGTTNDIPASVTHNVIVNYKGTGRDLAVFQVKADNPGTNTFIPGSVDNPQSRPPSGPTAGLLYGNAGILQSGFLVNYSTYVPYDSMSDVSVIPSESSYQIPGQNLLGMAYADQVDMGDQAFPEPNNRTNVTPHYTIKDENGGFALNNLQGKANYDPTSLTGRTFDSIYTSLTTPVYVDFQASSGLTKKVAPADGDGAGIFVDETPVEVGKDYSYRLAYTNSDYIEVDDLVLYDTLETANSAADHWQGTFKSVDTAVAEAKGIKPLIYLATEDPGPAALSLYDKTADPDDFTKWTVNSPWKLYDATITDPNDPGYIDLEDVKAVAIDLGWADENQTARYTLPQLGSVSVGIKCTAPDSVEYDDYVKGALKNTAADKKAGAAYNYAGLSMFYRITTGGEGTATTMSDQDKYTTVRLNDSRVSTPIAKVDDQATPAAVPGAQFKVEKDNGSDPRTLISDKVWSSKTADTTTDPAIAIGDLVYENTVTTDSSTDPATTTTIFTPLKLAPGTYYLTETAAPEGFLLAATEYKIVVTAGDPDATPPVAPKVDITYMKDGASVALAKNDAGKFELPNPKIDITITKKLLSTAIGTDGNVQYEVKLHNNKAMDVEDYVVTDEMTGLEYVSHTATGGTATYTAADPSTTPPTPANFKVDKVPANGDVTITVTCKVTADTWKNMVEPTTEAEIKTDKDRVADAAGTALASPAPVVNAGDVVYYKLTAKNTGTGNQEAGYQVVDTFSGLRYIGTDAALVDNGDGTLTWTCPAIAAGAEATVIASFIVEPTIEGDGDDVTTTIIGNSANGVATGEKIANITQEKELIANDVAEDGTVTYEIRISNNGGTDGKDYTVRDSFTGLTLVSASALPSSVGLTTVADGFHLDTVPMGEDSVVIVAKYTVTGDSFLNFLLPMGSDPAIEKVRVADENGTPVAVSDPSPVPGQIVYYKLTVDNTVENAVSWDDGAYKVDDTFTGMTYVGVSDEITDNGGGSITWNVPALAPGDKKEIIVPMKINQSTLTAGQREDTDLLVNAANNTIVSEKIPNVKVDKELQSAADAIGGTAVYTLTLSNTGTAEATDFKLTESMVNLEYQSAEVTTGSATISWDGSQFTVSNVPVGEDTVVITVKCTVTGASYSNYAGVLGEDDYTLGKIRCDADGNPADNEIFAGDTVYYKVTLDNTKGLLDVDAGMTFTDTFQGLTYVSATGDGSFSADGTVWTAPAVAAGKSASAIVAFTVNDGVTTVSNSIVSDEGDSSVVVADPVGVHPTPEAATGKVVTAKTGDDTGALVCVLAIAMMAGAAGAFGLRRRRD